MTSILIWQQKGKNEARATKVTQQTTRGDTKKHQRVAKVIKGPFLLQEDDDLVAATTIKVNTNFVKSRTVILKCYIKSLAGRAGQTENLETPVTISPCKRVSLFVLGVQSRSQHIIVISYNEK